MESIKQQDEWLFSLDKSKLVEIIIKGGCDEDDCNLFNDWVVERKQNGI